MSVGRAIMDDIAAFGLRCAQEGSIQYRVYLAADEWLELLSEMWPRYATPFGLVTQSRPGQPAWVIVHGVEVRPR